MSTRPRRRRRSACPTSTRARTRGSRSPQAAGLPADASLPRLVAAVDDTLADEVDHPAMLLRVVADTGGVEVAFVSLEPGAHPVDALIGFCAPEEWAAVGVAATGTTRTLDTDVPVAARRVRIVHLVDRGGREASLLHDLEEGTALPCPGPADGQIADLCRRMLGLPTAAPPPSVLPWWTILWLDRILAESLADPTVRWTWPRLALLHPAVDPAAHPLDPEALAEVAIAMAASVGWDTVRRDVASDDLADWMDDGMFARWALSQHLTPRQLAAELTAALDPPSLAAVLDTLAALDTRRLGPIEGNGEAW